MFLADTLSRAYLPQTCDDTQEEFEIINALTYLVMSDERIQATRQHTNCDPALQQLKQTIRGQLCIHLIDTFETAPLNRCET